MSNLKAANSSHIGALTYNRSQLAFYADGKLVDSKAESRAIRWGTQPWYLGGRNDYMSLWGTTEFGYLYDYALSASAVQALSENPWQIFQPIRRFIAVDMGAGGLSVPVTAQLGLDGDANPSLGVTSSPAGQLSGAADANAICGTVLPAMGETATICDAAPTLGTDLIVIASSASSTDVSATCGTVAAMVATGSVSGDITPPEPEEMPYIPPWRMAKVPFSGSRVAAVPNASRVSAVPAASRVAAVPASSRVAAVPAASRVAPARIE